MVPGTKHYAFKIDLLGRAGLVPDEALDLIKRIQLKQMQMCGAHCFQSAKLLGM
ncbi:hypothetical protein Sjap_005794 [Stephania japonica]|uniref:Uncharacterized protein n=1 Tax=Stephania japonica TaxID=461633 RepID=A0AAP0K4N3_9MAGN